MTRREKRQLALSTNGNHRADQNKSKRYRHPETIQQSPAM